MKMEQLDFLLNLAEKLHKVITFLDDPNQKDIVRRLLIKILRKIV
jgi:hypothetical protein